MSQYIQIFNNMLGMIETFVESEKSLCIKEVAHHFNMRSSSIRTVQRICSALKQEGWIDSEKQAGSNLYFATDKAKNLFLSKLLEQPTDSEKNEFISFCAEFYNDYSETGKTWFARQYDQCNVYEQSLTRMNTYAKPLFFIRKKQNQINYLQNQLEQLRRENQRLKMAVGVK